MKKIKHKSSTQKRVTIAVMSFLLSLVLVLLTIVSLANFTLFNDKYINVRIYGTDFFAQLSEDVYVKCKNIADKSGISYEPVADVLTANRIDTDMTVYFDSMSGENPTAGRETIDEEALANEIFHSITSHDSNITESERTNAEIIAEKIAREYKNAIVLDSFEDFIAFSQGYKSVAVYIFIILAALTVYLICVIIFLNGKRQKHRLYRHFAVVGGSSGITVLTLSLILKFSGVFEKMAFASSLREYNLFMDYFSEYMYSAMGVGVSWILICIILLVLWYFSVTGKVRR